MNTILLNSRTDGNRVNSYYRMQDSMSFGGNMDTFPALDMPYKNHIKTQNCNCGQGTPDSVNKYFEQYYSKGQPDSLLRK